MNRKPTLSVIVPMYREALNVKPFLAALQPSLENLKLGYEIIFVDDGSPDNTWAEITKAVHLYPMIRGVRLSRNFGKESALRAGLESAGGDALIFMDGDLQHPPGLIFDMVRLWREEKVQVVEAIKQHREPHTFISSLRAKLFHQCFRLLTGFDLDGASDFKLLDRKAADALRAMPERNLFFRGMSAWIGFKRVQIPFSVPERTQGTGNWSVVQLGRLALTAVTSFSSTPLHLVTSAGLLFFIFAVFMAVDTLITWAMGKAVSGFTTVNLLILIVGGCLMFGLGIIGEYIARIYQEIKLRPTYLVAETMENEN